MNKKIIVADVKWFTKRKLEGIQKQISIAVNPFYRNNIICAASNINIGTDAIIIRKTCKDTASSMFKKIKNSCEEFKNVVFVVREFYQLQFLIGIINFDNIIIAYEPYNKKMAPEEYRKNMLYLQTLFEKMFGSETKQKVTFICSGRMVDKHYIYFMWADGLLVQDESMHPSRIADVCNIFLQ